MTQSTPKLGTPSRNSSTVLKPFLLGLRLTNLYIGDFNGDKKSDILRQEKWFRDDDNKLTAQVIFSKGNGKFTASTLPESFALKGDETNLYIGDFDGDGKILPPSPWIRVWIPRTTFCM